MPDPLRHVAAKLAAGQAVAIGYFGGSITEGEGATEADRTSWRGLITTWFSATWPQAKIREINAAIGGTGSDLGQFRLDHDLLRFQPDLVFVEFAVNDGGMDPIRTRRCMESIVRQIWTADPRIDIAFVFTTAKPFAEAYEKSEVPRTVQAHQELADYYHIPTVNVGKVLWQVIHDSTDGKEGNASWATLTRDFTHPNDAGYALYAETIKQFLQPLILVAADNAPHLMPTPLHADVITCGKLIDTWDLDAAGWSKEDTFACETLSTPHCRPRARDGIALCFHWNGHRRLLADSTRFRRHRLLYKNGGSLKRLSSWDKYALKFTRANYKVLAEGLENKAHELVVRIAAEKNEKSTGTWIRIGALLLGQ